MMDIITPLISLGQLLNLHTIPDSTVGTGLGLMAALIFAVGLIVIHWLPKHKWLASAILIAIVTPFALGGLFWSAEKWGISDWDYYLSYYHNLRHMIVDLHAFPFWNPYTCGGTAGLGDPEFPLFSPLFLLVLLFGEITGLKLAIVTSVIIGSWGMLALTKKLHLTPLAGLLASLGTFFGTVNLLESVEGHQNILSAMYVPWVLFTWLSAYRSSTNQAKILWSMGTGLFLALMFFQGGIYLLMYTAFAFLALALFTKERLKSLTISAMSGAWAIGFSAIKLLPVFFWLKEFQDKAYASSTFTLPYIGTIFLGRYLHTYQDVIPNEGSAWHEYGAYIGPIILICALLAIVTYWKKRLVLALIISALLAISVSSTGPFLKPILDTLPFLPRSNIGRVILYAVIPLSLLAAIGLDRLKEKHRWQNALRLLMVMVAAIDIMTVTYPLSQQAFVVPEDLPAVSPAPAPIAFTTKDYTTRVAGVDYTRAYAATLAGYGTLSYCSVLTPDPAVRLISDEEDNGILSVKDSNNQITPYQLISWSPNTVTADVSLPTGGTATLNTNYAAGWQVNGQVAKEFSGRVGIEAPVNTSSVTFQYQAPGYTAGLIISLISTLAALVLLTKNFLPKDKH